MSILREVTHPFIWPESLTSHSLGDSHALPKSLKPLKFSLVSTRILTFSLLFGLDCHLLTCALREFGLTNYRRFPFRTVFIFIFSFDKISDRGQLRES